MDRELQDRESQKEKEMRDVFAMAAIGGLIGTGMLTDRQSVERAYKIADMMIQQRKMK